MFACQDFWLHTQGGAAITQLAAISFDAGELLSASNWLTPPSPVNYHCFWSIIKGQGGGNEKLGVDKLSCIIIFTHQTAEFFVNV